MDLQSRDPTWILAFYGEDEMKAIPANYPVVRIWIGRRVVPKKSTLQDRSL
jgi:hypothetical protein